MLAGGIAAYLASGGKQAAPPPAAAPPPPPAIETVDILAAKSDLSRGQVIGESDIGWQTWPVAAANASFIRKTDRPDAIKQFVGAIVRVPIASGQPIYDPMVVFAKGSGFLAAVLPKGMRAVATDISPELGAGGFILPEDHVDVVLTRRDREAEQATGTEKFVSSTILSNVRVLAVDQTVEEKNGARAVIGKTVTLELTEPQAETLVMSRQLGTISLTLRSLLDAPSSGPAGGDLERGSVNTVRYGVSSPGSY